MGTISDSTLKKGFTMETIILEFYEHRPIRFSQLTERVKVAEKDATNMTLAQIEKLLEIEEILGRSCEIRRIPNAPLKIN